MDVRWVIQGYTFGFQGFLIEFLGIADSLKNEIPTLRVEQ